MESLQFYYGLCSVRAVIAWFASFCRGLNPAFPAFKEVATPVEIRKLPGPDESALVSKSFASSR
jgi:hypothetical protein